MINTTTTKNYSNWNVLWYNMRNSVINYKCFMPCLVQCWIEEWDGSLYIVTRLWAGRPRNRGSILPWTWGHCLIQTIRNGSGAHPDFYSTATGGSLPSGRAAAARAIHLYLVTRLRILGATLPLPPIRIYGLHRVYMVCSINCGLDKTRDAKWQRARRWLAMRDHKCAVRGKPRHSPICDTRSNCLSLRLGYSTTDYLQEQDIFTFV